MTTYRHYTFATQLWTGHQEASHVLWRAACDEWWFTDPECTEEGQLEFCFWTAGRDLWFCHLRATRLATDAVFAAGGTARDVPVPTLLKRVPHDRRGFYAVVR